MHNLLNTTLTINALNVETFKKMNNLSTFNIKKIESNLYKTHFVNMMPQRGFLTSEQSLVTTIDIDLDYDENFLIRVFKEEDHSFLFVENGPIKISPYQKSFSLETKDTESLDYFSNCDFYILNGDFIKNNNLSTFLESNHEYTKVPFKKQVTKNKIIYKFNKKCQKILEQVPYLLYSQADNLNPIYTYKISIDKHISTKIFYTKGLKYIFNLIDKNFKKFRLSGNLYKTRNGLRILLTDKFRDLNNKNDLEEVVHLGESFLMDPGLLSGYKNINNLKLDKYLTRLTPKLKNYKYIDSSYKQILQNLESVDLSSLYLEKNIIPIKYDFKKTLYKTENKNEFIDEAFDLLKKMIIKYLKDDTFAVCSLLKSYKYGGENELINKYVSYHDKWTKAHLQNTILI